MKQENYQEELVSIIMPTFNGGDLIPRAVNSLFDQTYKNWECIIINDGSTDNTLDVIREMALIDNRIKYYSFEKNRGRAYARQKGLDMASGIYLAMLDSDDFYHPDKLSLQVKTMNENPQIALVSSGMYSFGEDYSFLTKRGSGNNQVYYYDGARPLKGVTHAPSLIRMSIAKLHHYDLKLNYGEDIDFLEKCLYRQNYYSLNNQLYYYSEFDSITFEKIRKTYLTLIQKYFRNRDVKNLSIFIFKYCISLIYFPIKGLKNTIKMRGYECSESEYTDFLKLKNSYEE